MKKYILLSRAIRNFGDYLIFERGKELITENCDIELFFGQSNIPLEKQFSESELKNCDGLIIPGGPGARPGAYGKTYKLDYLERTNLTLPVFFLGIGSKFSLFAKSPPLLENYSKLFFTKMASYAPIGCRDHLTMNYLRSQSINSVMNGCPAWYDVNSLGKDFSYPKKFSTIVCSTPVEKAVIKPFLEVIKKLKSSFSAEIYVSFNHGLDPERRAKEKITYEQDLFIQEQCLSYGCNVLDISGGCRDTSVYDNADLHIGCRVHSHIYFSSKRKPSILIIQDSRGLGVTESLSTKGVHGFNDNAFLISKIMGEKIARKVINHNRWNKNSREEDAISERVLQFLQEEINEGFPRMSSVGKTIDAYYKNSMQPFLRKYFR